ncbi:hypothetical protein DPMN_016431 [Dreissena polymorpha]|uniref:Uncharacterized protein n=1 Tax=Dreissena polymorpha TaxID=45954 RepID=A0A9D4NDI2_DREPO|nr:hypothetical protein DPMN_016431 [Dreissena polymorpha]
MKLKINVVSPCESNVSLVATWSRSAVRHAYKLGCCANSRGGRFSATATRAPSYLRLVAARLWLKDRAPLTGHITALRIEGTEALSD